MNYDSVGKVIDKYRIQSVLEAKENGVSIMRAINVDNGDHLMIKKAVIEKEDKVVSLSNLPESGEPTTYSALLSNEVNTIKAMNIPRVVRCLQMIKSKRSLYLVYENYPEMNLERYLRERCPLPALKIRFAQIICEVLQEIHRKGFAYVNLVPSSIYVSSGTNLTPSSYDLKFVGFEYAKKLSNEDNTSDICLDLLQENPFLAPEIIQEGYACPESDIFSAGKIFQMMGLTQIKGKNDKKNEFEIIQDMTSPEANNRPPIEKVWKYLKQKENETKLFDQNVLELEIPNSNRKQIDTISTASKERPGRMKVPAPIEKKKIEEEERRLRKIVKIRTLSIYLHELANFCLEEKSKVLFYLLLKKSVIVRGNLIHELRKMIGLYTGEHQGRLSSIREVLADEQAQSLDMLSKAEELLRADKFGFLSGELENRNELNEQLMEDQITEFAIRKQKEIRPLHSIVDEKERLRLIWLCGLVEKLAYGSFERFFDEVVDDGEPELSRQKHFTYLKNASTREISDRLERVLKQIPKNH